MGHLAITDRAEHNPPAPKKRRPSEENLLRDGPKLYNIDSRLSSGDPEWVNKPCPRRHPRVGERFQAEIPSPPPPINKKAPTNTNKTNTPFSGK